MLLVEDEVKNFDIDVVVSLRKHNGGAVDVEVQTVNREFPSKSVPILRFYPSGRIQRLKTSQAVDLFEQDENGRVTVE